MNKMDPAEKYVRLTTFTKDGRPKHTPVWFAMLDSETLCVITEEDSWKVKRLKNTSLVELAICDAKGKTEGVPDSVVGIARLVANTEIEFEVSNAALIEKYGFYYKVFKFIARLRGKVQCAVLISQGT